VGSGGGPLDGGDLGELEGGSGQLGGLGPPDFVLLVDDHGLKDVDILSAGTMSAGHLVVDEGDGVVEGVGSHLSVHVDDSSAGKVLEHDSVELDGVGLALVDLANRNDLSLAFSNLILSLHFVPELGPGDHDVLGEDSNSIAGGLGSSLRWEFPSHNPVLSDLETRENYEPASNASPGAPLPPRPPLPTTSDLDTSSGSGGGGRDGRKDPATYVLLHALKCDSFGHIAPKNE